MFMAYGMTYEQYWYGDPWMTRAYAQAYLLKRKIENENAWILGAYVANAFGTVIANSFGNKRNVKYLEKPLDLFPKTKAEKEAEIRAERKKVVEWLVRMQKAFNQRKNMGSESNGKP